MSDMYLKYILKSELSLDKIGPCHLKGFKFHFKIDAVYPGYLVINAAVVMVMVLFVFRKHNIKE